MIAMGMPLAAFFEDVYLPERLVGAADGTLYQYRLTVMQWTRHVGTLGMAGIDEARLGQFSRARLDDGAGPPTVNKDLRVLRALLHWAHRRGSITSVPEFSFLREDREEPKAFLAEEYGLIIDAARSATGLIGGLPAADWWESILLAGWDTGGRLGAMLAVRSPDLSLLAGTLYLRASTQKQGRGQLLHLHASTVEVCRRIWDDGRELVWPWPYGRDVLYRYFRRVLAAAGVETFSGTGSLFHRIRKSTASYVAAAGGNPTLQLGHSAESVTRRYLDPRICTPNAADLIPRPGK